MKTILITGGAGFIGSNFVRHLYRHYPDYRLLVLDALTYAGSVRNLPEDGFDSERFQFWYGNVRNGELVDSLVAQSDIVVHFAAETHVTRSIYDNFQFFETDVIGTQVVANAVLKYRERVELFIHVSTSEVYGTALTDTMSEEHPLNPMSPYAAAKCGADRLVHSYWATYQLPAVIVRPFNNFGPNQHLEKLIPRFITSCLLGEPLRLHGDGQASRDWMHVEDHCRALDLILHSPAKRMAGQVLNIGSGVSRRIVDIADAVREIMGTPEIPTHFIDRRPGQVFRHTADISRIKYLLDWEPRVSFEDGLARTVEWYRASGDWWKPQLWMRDIPVTTPSGTRAIH